VHHQQGISGSLIEVVEPVPSIDGKGLALEGIKGANGRGQNRSIVAEHAHLSLS